MLKPRLSVETSAFSPEVLPTLSAVGLECLAQRPTDRNVPLATLSLGRTLFDSFPQLVRRKIQPTCSTPLIVRTSRSIRPHASMRRRCGSMRLDDLPALLAIEESPALCRALSLSTRGCYG